MFCIFRPVRRYRRKLRASFCAARSSVRPLIPAAGAAAALCPAVLLSCAAVLRLFLHPHAIFLPLPALLFFPLWLLSCALTGAAAAVSMTVCRRHLLSGGCTLLLPVSYLMVLLLFFGFGCLTGLFCASVLLVLTLILLLHAAAFASLPAFLLAPVCLFHFFLFFAFFFCL